MKSKQEDLFLPPAGKEAEERRKVALLRSLHRDLYGNPITLLEAGNLFENIEYRRIGFTKKLFGYVSTVWMPFAVDGTLF